MADRKYMIILVIALIYVTISLACDPAGFRLINVFGVSIVSGASLIYAALYTLLDVLTKLAGRNRTFFLIFIFHLCDLLFSYILYFISLLPYPPHYAPLHDINKMFVLLPRFFWSGIIGSLVAGIAEVSIYAFLQSRVNSFFKASGLSTIIVLFCHDIPTAYYAYKTVFPDRVMQIVLTGFIFDTFWVIIYTITGAWVLNILYNRFDIGKQRSINQRNQIAY